MAGVRAEILKILAIAAARCICIVLHKNVRRFTLITLQAAVRRGYLVVN